MFSYGLALHDVALSVISGQPLGRSQLAARITEVLFALYSVTVFAALAGSFGAYFPRRSDW